MKKLAIGIVLAVGVLAVADTLPPLSPDQRDALTPIDTVPGSNVINYVFDSSGSAQSSLIAVALDGSSDNDTGVRLRAIAVLGTYDAQPAGSGDPIHQALLDIITANSSARSGPDLLVLRAAIETLGHLRVPTDVTTLAQLLDHPSRDIEASAALALGNLCNTSQIAINALRTRYAAPDTVDQVKLAISEALRILGQAPSACSVN